MGRWHGLAAAVLMVVASAYPAVVVGATPADQQILTFREAFGLTVNPEALSRATYTATSVAKYGVPLTAAEEKDIDARIVLQDQLAPLSRLVRENADVLGGLWIDQTATHGDGAIVTVGVTDATDPALVAKLVGLVPAGARSAFPSVAHSLRELTDAFNAAVDGTGVDPALRVVGVQLDIPANRVVIRYLDLGAGDSFEAGSGPVQHEPGAPLVPVSCTPAARCTFLPYRGGLQMIDATPQWWQCTAGYWAKQARSSNFYIITAAHCDRSPYNLDAYRDTNLATHLGFFNRDSIAGSGCTSICNTETYRVLIDSARVPATGRNCIYESAGLTCRTITTTAIWSNIAAGTVVCMAGVVSSIVCGTVSSIGSGTVHSDRYGRDITFTKGIYTNFVAQSGDSGAPLYGGSTAYGDVSSVGGGQTFSTSVEWALSDLGLSLCTTSTCPQ